MEGVDRINVLTDEMLVNNIMSRLDCTTKELIRTTATISKRWKDLWTQLPHLIFSYRYDHTYFGNDDTNLCDYISFIDNTLNQCPANLNLKKFKLYINYNIVVNSEFKSRANSWIRYAISRNVEDVDLWLRDVGVSQEFTFEDELFFKTSCITHMIENILSGSPCLESLELKNCHGYKRIDVTSRSFKKLVLSDYYYLNEEDYIDCIKINAPYISSLTIKGEFEVELVLLDVSSLIKAELDYCIYPGISDDITHEEMLRGLLESLNHVKDVIINDFWWEFYNDLKAHGDISNGQSNSIPLLELDFLSGSADIIEWWNSSLKLGRWKDIDDVPHIPNSWCHGTFSNRAFHWMVRDTPMSYHQYRLTNIVSLDLANETYGEVSPPPLYGEKCDGGISFEDFGRMVVRGCSLLRDPC
ncbi:thiamine thiazole synthase, chloroplastic-like protein [Tanacetum coccineum]